MLCCGKNIDALATDVQMRESNPRIARDYIENCNHFARSA